MIHPCNHQNQANTAKDELAQITLEAIVAISSFPHPNHVDDASCNQPKSSVVSPLQWFVDVVVSSLGDDLENKLKGYSSDNSGYFESMTLKLKETNVGGVLIQASGSCCPRVEDPGANMREEMPLEMGVGGEERQLYRQCTNCKGFLIQFAFRSSNTQLNGMEMGLEDRSPDRLGKTTRRPRRQRCPAGINIPPHPFEVMNKMLLLMNFGFIVEN
ncbi:Protein of unknown function DUF863, plant [Dillenia turbinata]|uniref:Uncharacterized protein n=1 Tax=Dillenia turbinata TaxID=194707 RepID=A0AAN8UTX9_9MAGN